MAISCPTTVPVRRCGGRTQQDMKGRTSRCRTTAPPSSARKPSPGGPPLRRGKSRLKCVNQHPDSLTWRVADLGGRSLLSCASVGRQPRGVQERRGRTLGERHRRLEAGPDSQRPPGAQLVMQNDGNLVVYAADGTAVWSTHTARRYVCRVVSGLMAEWLMASYGLLALMRWESSARMCTRRRRRAASSGTERAGFRISKASTRAAA